MIDCGVVRYLVNPRRKLKFGSIARKRVVSLNKNFLRQIQRRIVIAHHTIDVGRNGALITAHQFLEASFAARQRADDQFAIGQRTRFCQRNYCAHLVIASILRWLENESFKVAQDLRMCLLYRADSARQEFDLLDYYRGVSRSLWET